MALIIANAMPRKKYGETSFGERLHNIRLSYYETEADLPPAPAVISVAKALNVTSEARRGRKRLQMIATLPERNRLAAIRLIHSLVAAGAAQGGRHDR